MKYIPIVPIAFLNDPDFDIKQTLILAHLIRQDKKYLKRCVQFRGEKWLDNSYYETKPNCIQIDELIQLGMLTDSLIICIPDTQFIDGQQFFRVHQDAARLLHEYRFIAMGVVTCANDFRKELEEFKILNSIPEIDIISLPYNFNPPLDSRRPDFLDLIEKEVGVENIKKEIHLFGMYSIDNLKKEKRPWVSSIDGTMAFKEGFHKQKLPIPHEIEHSRSSFGDFFAISRLDDEQRECIKYNLKWLEKECE